MWVKVYRRIFAHSCPAASSPKALTRISRENPELGDFITARQVLDELAQMYPVIRGWIITTATSTKRRSSDPERIDPMSIRWARPQVQANAPPNQSAKIGLDRLRVRNPYALAHWTLCHCTRPNIGIRVTREGHARFWERQR